MQVKIMYHHRVHVYKITNKKINLKDDEINRTDLSSHLKINGDTNFNRLTATTITEIEF
jgi:hypothetical protein